MYGSDDFQVLYMSHGKLEQPSVYVHSVFFFPAFLEPGIFPKVVMVPSPEPNKNNGNKESGANKLGKP